MVVESTDLAGALTTDLWGNGTVCSVPVLSTLLANGARLAHAISRSIGRGIEVL